MTWSSAPWRSTPILGGSASTLGGGFVLLSSVRTALSRSGRRGPRKGVSSVRCWPISSCTTRRLFNEFALTLSAAVMISLVVSLTTSPMMCTLILPRERVTRHGRLYRAVEHVFDAMLAFYRTTLRVALRHPGAVMLTLLATIGLNYYVFRYQRHAARVGDQPDPRAAEARWRSPSGRGTQIVDGNGPRFAR